MRNVKIDDGIFGDSHTKDEDKNDKSKSAKNQKSKKKKGEDFLDYANKNGIELNLVYEDKAILRDEKRTFNTASLPTQIKKAPYVANSYPKSEKFASGQTEGPKKYYKAPYVKKPYHFKKTFKTGNNKFDQCNMHLSKMMPMMQPLYNPYTMQSAPQYMPNMMPNMNMGYYNPSSAPQSFPLPEIVDNSDKTVADFLEAYLSLENLNQDLYLRNRIDENGFIEASEIANHNKLRSRGVTVEKLAVIFAENTNELIEAVASEEGLFLRNRTWDLIRDKLMPKEYIHQQKKMLKSAQYMNQMNPVNQMNPMNTMNYVSMQNNYFFNGMPNTQENLGMSAMYMGYPNNMMQQTNMPIPNMEQGEN